MIIHPSTVAIIADDLTGANDSALQFQQQGAAVQILLDTKNEPVNLENTQTWAISTESRNIEPVEAYKKVTQAARFFKEKINPDFYYKKIDSTIRGNIAVEVLALLDELDFDVSVIIPAFPAESRVTVGGYHLLRGVPIERTEMARDPYSPIFESHLPTLLKSQLDEESKDLVGLIELKTVMKGAGPIIRELNNLISQGKKLIVTDAMSTVDIEQVILAIGKCEHKILPTGTAAAARILSREWLPDLEPQQFASTLPELPKFVVSGSATLITANQIDKLDESDEFENQLIISLDMKTILGGVTDELVDRVVNNLGNNNIVVVHTSKLIRDFDGFSEDSLKAELTKASLAWVITDFLAELTKRVIDKKKTILITLGGETSYKCCSAIGATQLQLIDEVAPAIALSKANSEQWIVTKSGNLGSVNTLIDILKYFEHHE